MSDQPQPIGELPNGDLVWPGPTYLIRIHGDPERYVDRDICDVIQNHYNVLARIEPERAAMRFDREQAIDEVRRVMAENRATIQTRSAVYRSMAEAWYEKVSGEIVDALSALPVVVTDEMVERGRHAYGEARVGPGKTVQIAMRAALEAALSREAE